MGLKIYNTLSQKKEEFRPLEPGHVKMYVCGPTVYNLVHVGNFRGPIFFNYVRNFFERTGQKVTYVYNYTDVDDKIIKAANEEKTTSDEIAQRYIKEFEKDFAGVGLKSATFNPRVTTHMDEIIKLIENIISSGAGYVVDGEVFCSVSKIKDYGKLSHKNIDELQAGARVEIGEKKKNPLDFSLWKPAKPGEPFWESPWGKGRPGWHIECSAMAKKYLGDTFDIHGGGIDLIFPHHENEIAQSESGNGKPFVNYWMHNNFINMGKEKMSKSLGNIFTARNFLTRYNGEILKFLILSSHYRSPSDFSDNVISHSIHGLARVYSALAQANRQLKRCETQGLRGESVGKTLDDKVFAVKAGELWPMAQKASEDDFNTPEIFAEIFNLVRSFNAILKPGIKPSIELANSCRLFIEKIRDVGGLLSLFEKEPEIFLNSLDDLLLNEKGLQRAEIQSKVDLRWKARLAKDFATSDSLRDELSRLGIEVRDSQEGCEWEVKK
ncbi:MAG: cysteine--tRNA ligase [Oligoflexia bacterium]|nr:cysteine--tRNA ligase [Oligoflexia bacterium]